MRQMIEDLVARPAVSAVSNYSRAAKRAPPDPGVEKCADRPVTDRRKDPLGGKSLTGNGKK